MSILTERKRWERTKPQQKQTRDDRRTLTPAEQANVRRALRALLRHHGGLSALATTMGMTRDALTKARIPSRTQSARLALATARVAGCTFDALVSGEWRLPPRMCSRCKGTGYIHD